MAQVEYKSKNQILFTKNEACFTVKKEYDKVLRFYSKKDQEKFEVDRIQFLINEFGFKMTTPISRNLESEFVYKINKKHYESLYKSEGFLHERSEALTFPKNKLQKYKLIDDYYRETNRDMLNKLCEDISVTNINCTMPNTTSNRNPNTTKRIIKNHSVVSKISEVTSPNHSMRQLNSSFTKNNYYNTREDYSPNSKSYINIKENLSQDNKDKRLYDLSSPSVLERPVVKLFNVSTKVNHYRLKSNHIFENINFKLATPDPFLQNTDELKTQKEKNFFEHKKDLVRLLEKNNQKLEVQMDKKLHYFYKTTRSLDEDKMFVDMFLGKITPEEFISKCNSNDLKQNFLEFQKTFNLQYQPSQAEKFKSTKTFKDLLNQTKPSNNKLTTSNLNVNRDLYDSIQSGASGGGRANALKTENLLSKKSKDTMNKLKIDNIDYKLKVKSDNFETFRDRTESINSFNRFKSNMSMGGNNGIFAKSFSNNINFQNLDTNNRKGNQNYFSTTNTLNKDNAINNLLTPDYKFGSKQNIQNKNTNGIYSCNAIPMKKSY